MAPLILLVEESETDVDLFRRALEARGVANPMVAVKDGNAAHRYFAGEEPFGNREAYPLPGVLILNLDAPLKDGYEVLKWARTQPHLKEVLIVVVSRLHNLSVVRNAYSLGANWFLVKPFLPGDIEHLILGFPQYWTRK